MSYAHITRPDTIGSITASKLLPSAGHFINTYGNLLQAGETLTLIEFADRIDAHHNNFRTMIEAGELRRWLELIHYCEDSIVNFGTLPVEFEYTDGVYDFDDIVKVLGPEAMNFLLSEQAA